MELQRFELKHLPQAITLFVETYKRDTLNIYVSNDLTQHAGSLWRRCANYLRSMIVEQGNQCFVAISPPSPRSEGRSEGEVMGFIVAHRVGTSATARKWQAANPVSNTVERWSGWASSKYYGLFPRTLSVVHAEHMANVMPILSDPWDTPLLDEAWIVEGLYVHPRHQRKGVGRELLKWVQDRAGEEGVPVAVKGSARGGLAYRRCGFESVGFDRFGQWFDEVELGGEGMQVWVWVPEALKGKGVVEGLREWWVAKVGEDVAAGIAYKA